MDLHLRNPHCRRVGLLEVQQVRWRTGVSGLLGRCAQKASLHQKSKGMGARHRADGVWVLLVVGSEGTMEQG